MNNIFITEECLILEQCGQVQLVFRCEGSCNRVPGAVEFI